MALLSTSPELPSSDNDDADFAPEYEDTAVEASAPAKRKASQAPVALQAPELRSDKRLKPEAAWEHLKKAQLVNFPKQSAGVSITSLCKPTANSRSASGGQDWAEKLGLQHKDLAHSGKRTGDQAPKATACSPAAPARLSSRATAATALAQVGGAAAPLGKETRRFAGKDIQVSQPIQKRNIDNPELKGQHRLDNVLQSLSTVKDVSTLDKSRSDWDAHKQINSEEAIELEKYNRSNNNYLDRQDFLSRTNVKEYVHERDHRLAGDVRGRL